MAGSAGELRRSVGERWGDVYALLVCQIENSSTGSGDETTARSVLLYDIARDVISYMM